MFKTRRSSRRALAALAAGTALLTAACGSSSNSSSSGSAAAASAPGISSKTITVGMVTSLTGPAAFNFNGARQGVQARIDLQNAEGGVDGRKIVLDVEDDQSSTQQAQTATSLLIQQKHAFGLIYISDLVSSAYRIAQQANVPVVGAPIDGPEWGEQPNTNMVSINGDQGKNLPIYTYYPKVAKLAGITNAASLAIANEQPSVVGATRAVTAFQKVGIPVSYKNYSIPLGTVDVGPVVLGMQAAHVNGFVSFMLNTTDFAIMGTAKQQGLKLVGIDQTSYTQDLLNNPSALAAAQGMVTFVNQVPVEEHTPATQKEQAAFAKYENFTGVPNLNWTYGWEAGDLFIKGLQEAGKNPTRASFLNALRNTTNWTAGGLLPQAPDFSLKDFGKPAPTSCAYFAQVKGKGYVAMNNGKPICGSITS